MNRYIVIWVYRQGHGKEVVKAKNAESAVRKVLDRNSQDFHEQATLYVALEQEVSIF